MSQNLDLRKYIDDEKTHEAYSLLVSGKSGYKAIVERKREIPRCLECSITLSGEEKFCPECGTKVQATKQ